MATWRATQAQGTESEEPEETVILPYSLENLPACEDEIMSLEGDDALSDNAVLKAHRKFRILISRLLVFYGIAPAIGAIVGSATYVVWDVIMGAGASVIFVATAFTGMIGFGVGLVAWLLASFQVERRFSAIMRHAKVAASDLDIDDEEHAATAAATLIRTFVYRSVLIRWLIDIRDSYRTVSILFIIATIAAGLTFQDWVIKNSALFAVVPITALILPFLPAALLRQASRGSTLEPTTHLTERISALITEVKDLRRGIRRVA